MKIKELNELTEKIEAKKVELAKGRDELRELVCAYTDILDSFDSGLEDFDFGLDHLRQGKHAIETALDNMSQYL